MTALARLAALVPVQPHPQPATALREVLGAGRLAAAVELGDAAAVDRLVDALLADEWLGRRIVARVVVRAGQALGEGR